MKVSKEAIISSLSGFQYGYNTSVIAGAILFLTSAFALNPYEEGLVVSITFLSTCLASFSGVLANRLGRKNTLVLGTICFLIGCLCTCLASHYLTLLTGRLFIGFGAGVAMVAGPLYLVEVSSPENRGFVTSMNQISSASGSLCAYLACYLFAFSSNWKGMFALGIIPAVIQMVGFFFIKEPPRDAAAAKTVANGSWKKVVDPSLRSRLYLVLILSFFQAFVGFAVISYYAPIVFKHAGFSDVQDSLLATVLLGVIYLLAILASSWFVDRFGRRVLLFSSFLGMAVCLFTVTLFSAIHSPYLDVVSLVSILAYVICYSLGVGPIPPLLISEISPLMIRGHFLTLMGVLGWLSNYVIGFAFPIFMEKVTLGGVFLFHGICCLIGYAILYRRLPETKQKSFKQIEQFFAQHK